MISYINIAGKNYPLSFSLMAQKLFIREYGDLGKLEKLESGELGEETIDILTSLVEILISQGCAYKNYFEKDVPTKETDPVENGKWIPLERDAIEIGIGYSDFVDVINAVFEAINSSRKTEIEAESTEGAEKNAIATQEK